MQEYTSPSERLKALTDQLEQGVSDIFQSGQYAAYLTAMSKFHHYSFGNTMLIFMQCPNATNVAGYHDWRRNFGRQVKRGERGITILAPCPYRRQEEVEETAPDGSSSKSVQWVQRMSFRTVTVFDIGQTEGKPLPEIARKLTGDVAQYESMVAALRSISPYPISMESFPGGAYGCCNFVERRILVQPDMSQIQTIKTMIHEVSHAKLHAPIEDGDGETPPQRKRRFVREMEAESVAYHSIFCYSYYCYASNGFRWNLLPIFMQERPDAVFGAPALSAAFLPATRSDAGRIGTIRNAPPPIPARDLQAPLCLGDRQNLPGSSTSYKWSRPSTTATGTGRRAQAPSGSADGQMPFPAFSHQSKQGRQARSDIR